MKKTISINLANRSFYIEEDAYNILNAYIQSIEIHYHPTDPEGEIVGDIEERLSEIFASKIRLGHEVITLDITKEAMGQLGKLEDILDEPMTAQTSNDSPHEEFCGQGHGHTHSTSDPYDTTHRHGQTTRKMYKDPMDRWISGLLGGLAKYSGLDPIFIRIIFILLLFTPINWILITLYIACAIFIPTARTVNQRLEMEGTQVNPDSIWRKVNEESSQMAQTLSSRLNDLGISFKGRKNSDQCKTPETQTPEEEATAKRKRRSSNIIYSIVGIGVALALGLSLIWLITTLSTGDFYDPRYWDNFFQTSILSGAGILLLISILIIVLLAFSGIFALTILPIGLILRSKSAPVWKIIGILGWIILLSVIFH